MQFASQQQECITDFTLEIYFNRIVQLVYDRCVNTEEVVNTLGLDGEDAGLLPLVSVDDRYRVIQAVRKKITPLFNNFVSEAKSVDSVQDCYSRMEALGDLVERWSVKTPCPEIGKECGCSSPTISIS